MIQGISVNIDGLFRKIDDSIDCFEVDILSVDDEILVEISNRLGLALSLDDIVSLKLSKTDLSSASGLIT